jgi:Tfp pilus assembly protein PilF
MAAPAFPAARRPWLGVAALLALVALVYLPSVRGGFLWDDDASLTANPAIRSADGLRQFWLTTRTPDYWPVTATSLWAEWRLWGLDATGYRVTNLVLHAGAVLLLWAVLRRLRVPGAWFAAALFAVHPVNVESVAWITERKNLLALVFFLLAVDGFLRWREPRPAGRGAGAWYALSLAWFVLAMLSKGSVVILPVVLLGIIAWERPLRAADLARLGPFWAVAVVLTGVNIWFQGHQLHAHETIRNLGALDRLLEAGGVIWFYLGHAVLPLHQVFIYPPWHVDAAAVAWWLPLAAAAAVTLLLWRRGRSRAPAARWWRGAWFAWAFFGAAQLPVMGFTDVYFMKFSLVADHYGHLALIGVVAFAAAGASAGWRRTPALVLPLMVLLIGGMTVLSARRAALFADGEALLVATARDNPASAMVRNNLGVIYAGQGRLPEAAAEFEAALRLDPGYADAERNLGLALARAGRSAEAVAHYEAALRIQPDLAEAHDDLGNALLSLGRPAEAIPHFAAALARVPADAEAECNLGIALGRLGRVGEALPHYERAVQLEPGNAVMQFNLANMLMRAGQPAAAADHYRAVLRLRPGDPAAQSNLAEALRSGAGP